MNHELNNAPDPELLEEYDFRGGVRSKYLARFAEGARVVALKVSTERGQAPFLT